MASNNDQWTSGLSRRRCMQIVGAGAVSALAGCGGGGSSPSGTLVSATNVVPTQFQYNSYNPNNIGLNQVPSLADQLAYLNPNLMEFQPGAAADWSVDGQSASITIQDDHTWHNGDDVTAEDLVIKLRLAEYYDDPVWGYLDSVEQVDESTVELALAEQVNDFIFKDTLLTMTLDTPRHLYREHLEDLENASDQSEVEEVMGELSQMAIEEPFGNGPFEVDDVNTQASNLSKHDGHPASGDINFDEVTNNYYGENQGIWQGLIHGEVDVAGVATPPEVVDQFPSNIEQHVNPVYRGMALYFNYQDDVFSDVRVRKAIAHAIGRDAAATNAHPEYWGVEVLTGMPQTDPYLSDVVGEFQSYTGGQERAAELMREAGYERSGGTWVDSDGNALSFPFRAPAGFGDWVTGSQTLVSELDDFGFDAELLTSDIPTFFGNYRSQGNFRVLSNYWGGQNPYPYSGFDRIYGSDFPAYPEEWEVPMPVGEPDGSMETVNPSELLAELSVSSGAEAEELIREIAWIVNQTLPVVPIWMQIGQGFFNTDDWEVPDQDSDLGGMDIGYWIRSGEFSRKE